MKSILIEQNIHWRGEKYKSVKRDALDKLISYIPLNQIITITGIRRCGKSTLVKQAINHLIESGIDAKNIFFINLENPYFLEHRQNASYLDVIFDEYLRVANPSGKIYCIFDEIQYFENWQVYVKSKYESSDTKFIITGSNSSMLSNDLNTLLSGRSLNIHLDTFSFTEFLDYKEINFRDNILRIHNKIAIQRAKDEYIKWGGFFEVFELEDELIKKEILINYVKNIIYQDIVPRYNIRNSHTLEKLFFYLLTNTTGILNYTTLSKIFEINDRTIKEYINYFEDVFLFKRIDKFHNKSKEKIKSSKKLYTLDNGFLQIPLTSSKNLGSSLENIVFIVLNKDSQDITYLKDTYEMDFFCEDKCYQVSYNIDDEKTRKRELNSFKHFNKNNKYENIVVTYDTNEQLEDIDIVSFEEFIINQT